MTWALNKMLGAALAVVVAVVALYQAGRQVAEIRTFLDEAAFADGTVTAIEAVGPRQRSYRIDFRFLTRDGNAAAGAFYVPAFWSRWTVGDPVQVAYHPAAPSAARRADIYALWRWPVLFAALGLTFLGVAAAIARARPKPP